MGAPQRADGPAQLPRARHPPTATIGDVSRAYTPAEADALIPAIAALIERLRALRDEVVTLRDAYLDRETVVLEELIDAGASDHAALGVDAAQEPLDEELRRLRLRIRGLVDQMQADAAWLDDREIVLRDIATGLLDFPGDADGQRVWLCWRRGETRVGYVHGRDEGYSRRRPIGEFNLKGTHPTS